MPIVPSPPRQHPRPTLLRVPHAPPARVEPACDVTPDCLAVPPLTAAANAAAPAPAPPCPAAPESTKARTAVAAVGSAHALEVQHWLPYIVNHFETPDVQTALARVPQGSSTEQRILCELTNALCDMSGEAAEDWDDLPMEPIAIYLLQRCSWDAICEPRLFDKLQLVMRGDVAMAFIAAEARDAAAARACASEIFANAPNPTTVIENILMLRRIQFWDSFLQVQSAAILRDAIDSGDFSRVEQLLAFAPNSSTEEAARILFEAVGPGDGIVPALRAFCAERHLTVPQTLQPAPTPVTMDYVSAILQRVVQRGIMPTDLQFFWQTLEQSPPDIRERLLRSDLDSMTSGELTVVLCASPSTRVVQAFPQALLGQLLQTYADRFECPMTGFGVEFAMKLVDALPQAQVDALVAMKEYIVVHDLLEVGQWSLLGKIVQRAGDATRAQVLALLSKPAPPRDERFGAPSHTDATNESEERRGAPEVENIGRFSTIPGNPTAVPPPIAYI